MLTVTSIPPFHNSPIYRRSGFFALYDVHYEEGFRERGQRNGGIPAAGWTPAASVGPAPPRTVSSSARANAIASPARVRRLGLLLDYPRKSVPSRSAYFAAYCPTAVCTIRNVSVYRYRDLGGSAVPFRSPSRKEERTPRYTSVWMGAWEGAYRKARSFNNFAGVHDSFYR